MKDRLKHIMEQHALTPASMADKMGIQRSSISHLLSGRNKPSYDFIYKFLKTYSFVDAHWFITGEHTQQIEKQRKQESNKSAQPQFSLFNQPENPQKTPFEKKTLQNEDISTHDEHGDEISNSHEDNSVSNLNSKDNTQTLRDANRETLVERIVWFFSDGSFKEYKPS